MKDLYLVSALDLYDKNELGERFAHKFKNKNNILSNLKKSITKFDNFVYIYSDPKNIELSKMYFDVTVSSFEQTLPFKNYIFLDCSKKSLINKTIKSADFIFLAGGHVPTQNNFFKKINLKEIIKQSNAVVLGGSAGAMNCADIVYAQPELEGESLDTNFKIYIEGLGLTKINLLPHFKERINDILDGKNIFEKITKKDSFKKAILAISDDSYIKITNDTPILFGNATYIKNGELIEIIAPKNGKKIDFLNFDFINKNN